MCFFCRQCFRCLFRVCCCCCLCLAWKGWFRCFFFCFRRFRVYDDKNLRKLSDKERELLPKLVQISAREQFSRYVQEHALSTTIEIYQCFLSVVWLANFIYYYYLILRTDKPWFFYIIPNIVIDFLIIFVWFLLYMFKTWERTSRIFFLLDIVFLPLSFILSISDFVILVITGRTFIVKYSRMWGFCGVILLARLIPSFAVYRKAIKSQLTVNARQHIMFAVMFLFVLIVSGTILIQFIQNEFGVVQPDDRVSFELVLFITLTISQLQYYEEITSRIAQIFLTFSQYVAVAVILQQATALYLILKREGTKFVLKKGLFKMSIKNHVILDASEGISASTISDFLREFFDVTHGKHKHDKVYVVLDETLEGAELDEWKEIFSHKYFAQRVFVTQGNLVDYQFLRELKVNKSYGVFLLSNLLNLEYSNESDTLQLSKLIAIKNFSSSTKVFCHIIEPGNRLLFLQAEADSVVCVRDLKTKIMARSLLTPGLPTILSNLLYSCSISTVPSFRYSKQLRWMKDYCIGANKELYVVPFSPVFFGDLFVFVADTLFQKHGICLMGVVKVGFDEDGRSYERTFINPLESDKSKDEDEEEEEEENGGEEEHVGEGNGNKSPDEPPSKDNTTGVSGKVEGDSAIHTYKIDQGDFAIIIARDIYHAHLTSILDMKGKSLGKDGRVIRKKRKLKKIKSNFETTKSMLSSSRLLSGKKNRVHPKPPEFLKGKLRLPGVKSIGWRKQVVDSPRIESEENLPTSPSPMKLRRRMLLNHFGSVDSLKDLENEQTVSRNLSFASTEEMIDIVGEDNSEQEMMKSQDTPNELGVRTPDSQKLKNRRRGSGLLNQVLRDMDYRDMMSPLRTSLPQGMMMQQFESVDEPINSIDESNLELLMKRMVPLSYLRELHRKIVSPKSSKGYDVEEESKYIKNSKQMFCFQDSNIIAEGNNNDTQINTKDFFVEVRDISDLEGHVVVMGDMKEAVSVVMILRSRMLYNRERPVILVGSEEDGEELQKTMKFFKDVYFFKGNPTDPITLKNVRTMTAYGVLYMRPEGDPLYRSKYSNNRTTHNQIVDASCIRNRISLSAVARNIRRVNELVYRRNIKFFRDFRLHEKVLKHVRLDNPVNNHFEKMYLMSYPVVSGSVFTQSFLFRLVCQSFYRASYVDIVESLSGFDKNFDSSRSTVNIYKLPSVFNGETFGSLFRYYLIHRRMIVIGLYRKDVDLKKEKEEEINILDDKDMMGNDFSPTSPGSSNDESNPFGGPVPRIDISGDNENEVSPDVEAEERTETEEEEITESGEGEEEGDSDMSTSSTMSSSSSLSDDDDDDEEEEGSEGNESNTDTTTGEEEDVKTTKKKKGEVCEKILLSNLSPIKNIRRGNQKRPSLAQEAKIILDSPGMRKMIEGKRGVGMTLSEVCEDDDDKNGLDIPKRRKSRSVSEPHAPSSDIVSIKKDEENEEQDEEEKKKKGMDLPAPKILIDDILNQSTTKKVFKNKLPPLKPVGVSSQKDEESKDKSEKEGSSGGPIKPTTKGSRPSLALTVPSQEEVGKKKKAATATKGKSVNEVVNNLKKKVAAKKGLRGRTGSLTPIGTSSQHPFPKLKKASSVRSGNRTPTSGINNPKKKKTTPANLLKVAAKTRRRTKSVLGTRPKRMSTEERDLKRIENELKRVENDLLSLDKGQIPSIGKKKVSKRLKKKKMVVSSKKKGGGGISGGGGNVDIPLSSEKTDDEYRSEIVADSNMLTVGGGGDGNKKRKYDKPWKQNVKKKAAKKKKKKKSKSTFLRRKKPPVSPYSKSPLILRNPSKKDSPSKQKREEKRLLEMEEEERKKKEIEEKQRQEEINKLKRKLEREKKAKKLRKEKKRAKKLAKKKEREEAKRRKKKAEELARKNRNTVRKKEIKSYTDEKSVFDGFYYVCTMPNKKLVLRESDYFYAIGYYSKYQKVSRNNLNYLKTIDDLRETSKRGESANGSFNSDLMDSSYNDVRNRKRKMSVEENEHFTDEEVDDELEDGEEEEGEEGGEEEDVIGSNKPFNPSIEILKNSERKVNRSHSEPLVFMHKREKLMKLSKEQLKRSFGKSSDGEYANLDDKKND